MPILKIVLKTPTKLTMDLSSKLNIQKNVELQNLDITPTEETQTYSPVKPYDGFGDISVKPIPSEYIVPQGTITISGNEPTNVREYEYAQVEQPIDELDLIRFYDYDGTLLYTYTRSQIEALDELPPAPEHERLLFQEWNWSLEDLKALERGMDVGATYTTKSGKVEVEIVLTPVTGLTFRFGSYYDVDWGDGTITTGTTSHTYTEYGRYLISIDVQGLSHSDMFSQSSSSHNKTVISVAVPSGSISSRVLEYCDNLETIVMGKDAYSSSYLLNYDNLVKAVVIPNNKNMVTIGTQMFYDCASLRMISLPIGITRIERYGIYSTPLEKLKLPPNITTIAAYGLTRLQSLKTILFPLKCRTIYERAFEGDIMLETIDLSSEITKIPRYLFTTCFNLRQVYIPDTVVTIDDYSFQTGGYVLSDVNLPNSLSTVGTGAFNLTNYIPFKLPNTIEVISGDAFNNCKGITSVVIPTGVVSIGASAFSSCSNLKSFAFGDGIKIIRDSVLSYCSNLQSIYLPNTITTINANAFNGCYSMRKYDFSQFTAIPTLANINAFSGINAQCKIVVPDELYDEWISATNWTTYANYIYKASEVQE